MTRTRSVPHFALTLIVRRQKLATADLVREDPLWCLRSTPEHAQPSLFQHASRARGYTTRRHVHRLDHSHVPGYGTGHGHRLDLGHAACYCLESFLAGVDTPRAAHLGEQNFRRDDERDGWPCAGHRANWPGVDAEHDAGRHGGDDAEDRPGTGQTRRCPVCSCFSQQREAGHDEQAVHGHGQEPGIPDWLAVR
jgi:hypothetical protein